MAPEVGVVFPPWFPPERFRAVVEAAQGSGVPELWVWEDCFFESGLSMAAAALGWTDTLRVRVGLMPVPLRNVAITAMELATLDRLFPGRFQAVLGHGVQGWMGQVGARADSPVTMLREHLTALRRLLGGDTVTMHGDYVRLDSVTLAYPPAAPVTVMGGATGPRSLALLGEVADAILIDSGTSPRALRDNITHIGTSASAAGRPMPGIAVYLHAVTGQDARRRLGERVGDLPDDVDQQAGAFGDGAAIAEAVRRWGRSGAGTVILRPPEDDLDIEGYVRFVGREVVPRI